MHAEVDRSLSARTRARTPRIGRRAGPESWSISSITATLCRARPRAAPLLVDNEGGDALDAVIGAVATARADLTKEADAYQRLEGRVYFEIG